VRRSCLALSAFQPTVVMLGGDSHAVLRSACGEPLRTYGATKLCWDAHDEEQQQGCRTLALRVLLTCSSRDVNT
jgi:hypothetical protein